jgi:hypothetical protein
MNPFEHLPRRIFLESCAAQTLRDRPLGHVHCWRRDTALRRPRSGPFSVNESNPAHDGIQAKYFLMKTSQE